MNSAQAREKTLLYMEQFKAELEDEFETYSIQPQHEASDAIFFGRVIVTAKSGELLVCYMSDAGEHPDARFVIDDFVPELAEAGEFDPKEAEIQFDPVTGVAIYS